MINHHNEDLTQVDEEKPEKLEVGDVIDEEYHILIGNELQIFLNSDLVTPGNVNTILQSKGVFVGDTSKDSTVPLLAGTILTPDEFFQLINFVRTKEARHKYRTATIDLNIEKFEDSPWKNIIQDSVENLKSEMLNKIPNTDFYGVPLVSFDNDEATISYRLQRYDYNKDMFKREEIVSGEIRIRPQDDKLHITLIHTSSETEEVNPLFLNKISVDLYNHGITRSDKIQQILFEDFTNYERILFFNCLYPGDKRLLKKGVLVELDVEVDSSQLEKMPNDPELAFLKDGGKEGIGRLKTFGRERLNNSFFIKRTEYYQYYVIPRIELEYDFAVGGVPGKVLIEIEFKKKSKGYEGATLSFSVRVGNQNKLSQKAGKNIEKEIYSKMQTLIENEYEKILVKKSEENKDK